MRSPPNLATASPSASILHESVTTLAIRSSGTAQIDTKPYAGARDFLSNCTFEKTNVADPVCGGCSATSRPFGLVGRYNYCLEDVL